jgi:CHAT domain-containing protein
MMTSLAFLWGAFVNAAPQSTGDEAEETFRRAAKRMETAVEAIRKSGNSHDGSDDLVAAESEFAKSYRLFAARSDPKATFALLRSADCVRILERWADARDRYRETVALASRNKQAEYEAKAWLGIAKSERIGLRNYRAASEATDQALRAAQSAGLRTFEVDILFDRSQLQQIAGEFNQAVETLGEVIKRSRETGDNDMQQLSLDRRADLKTQLAQQAFSLYVSLPYKTRSEWLRCQEVENQAREYLLDARQDQERSAQLAEVLGRHHTASNVKEAVRMVDALLRNLDNTVEIKRNMHLSQRDPAAKDDNRPLVTANGRLIEVNLVGPSIPGSSEEERRKFIADLRASLGRVTPTAGDLWMRRFTEGKLFEAEGDLVNALKSYREAARLVEEERRTLFSDVSRAGFSADKIDLYNRLILNLLNSGTNDEAFHWIEQSRARATADLLWSAELRLPDAADRRLYSQMLALRSAKKVAGNQGSAVSTARTPYEELLDHIRRESPRLLELVDSEPPTFAEVRRIMRERSFDLVYYILHQGRLVIWHIGPEHTHVRSYFAPPSELLHLKQNLMGSLSAEHVSFASTASKSLYVYLVRQVMEWMESPHLVIVPPPELQELPFQTLFDEQSGKYLGAKIAISYAPSASVLAKLRPGLPLDGARVLVVLGPDLKHGPEDADAISASYKDSVVIRPESATRSVLMRQAANRTLVHFATHGEYDKEDPMRSRIRLQPEPGHNGSLTAAEMFELPLLGTALVTLASCEAAQVTTEANNELFGITRSLLYAGAQNLLLPLWKVDDEATAFWLRAFYQAARSNSLPQAAMLANREALNNPKFGVHPRFWAPFMLIGH